jgi:Flp pilus assembly pilin Flp
VRRATHASGRAPDFQGVVTKVLRVYVTARAWWDGMVGEEGATAVEYAIMLALIAMVVIAAVTILGQETNSAFEQVQFPD